MYAHVVTSFSGWWAGVLQPMRGPDHLITLLLVGLLGGLAVRAGRSSWSLPAIFMVGLATFGIVGLAVDRSFDVDPVLIALAAVLAVMVFVHPRHLGVIAPAVALVSGALHGLAHGADAAGTAGFVFTSGVLLTVGAIVGAAVGRSQLTRRPLVPGAFVDSVDDRALV